MSIVQTVLHPHKLRQERHGLEHRNYRSRRSLPAKHAAPDGAWMASGGPIATDMPLLRSCSAPALLTGISGGTQCFQQANSPGQP